MSHLYGNLLIILTRGITLLCTIFWIALCSPHHASSQVKKDYVVAGQVTDSESGIGLQGVHVYYSGTSVGDVTNQNGHFRLPPAPVKTIDVAFSMIGYDIKVYSLDFRTGSYKNLYVHLSSSISQLDSITVLGDIDHEWLENLKRFKEHFFGDSTFGQFCRILNPEILSFEYNRKKEELKTTAPEPLIVVNDALGYKIEFGALTLEGSPKYYQWNSSARFIELKSDDANEIRQWTENRENAYNGSIRHLLTALVRGQLVAEEFEVFHVILPRMDYRTRPIPEMQGVRALREAENDSTIIPILFPGPEIGLYSIQVPNTLMVLFMGESESKDYDQSYGTTDSQYQSSWLHFWGASILVDYNGHILARQRVSEIGRLGYMGWERVGELLPLDYSPGDTRDDN